MASFRKVFAAATVAGLMLAGAGTAAVSRLTVGNDAIVQGDTVHLRDIGTCDGTVAEALADVTIGKAPNAGESRTFDGGYVLGVLQQAGLDPSRVTYSIPPLIRVRRAGQTLDGASLRPAVERWLEATLGDGARDAELRELDLANPITVPLAAWDARVVAAPRDGIAGRVRLQLEITTADQPPRSVWVTADVARWVPVVVPRRAIARGDVIVATDLDLDRRDLASLPRDVVTTAEEVVGTSARQPLLPYAPMRRDQIANLPVVRRGDLVQLVAQHGPLRITAAGEVRQDARRGDSVRVVNRSSQKELIGRVVDASTVEVGF